MISKQLAEALNTQMNFEFDSANLYLSMSAFAEGKNYPGAAHWFRKQVHEEQEHAMKMYKYLVSVGEKVTVKGMPDPETEFAGYVDLFKKALEHERIVTSRINNLIEIAQANKDFAANSFLQWFVDEQVEEEENLNNILDRLALTDNSAISIVMMDDRLASR